jgi:hypothetical protein
MMPVSVPLFCLSVLPFFRSEERKNGNTEGRQKENGNADSENPRPR